MTCEKPNLFFSTPKYFDFKNIMIVAIAALSAMFKIITPIATIAPLLYLRSVEVEHCSTSGAFSVSCFHRFRLHLFVAKCVAHICVDVIQSDEVSYVKLDEPELADRRGFRLRLELYEDKTGAVPEFCLWGDSVGARARAWGGKAIGLPFFGFASYRLIPFAVFPFKLYIYLCF
jgi:hypothetical protein